MIKAGVENDTDLVDLQNGLIAYYPFNGNANYSKHLPDIFTMPARIIQVSFKLLSDDHQMHQGHLMVQDG